MSIDIETIVVNLSKKVDSILEEIYKLREEMAISRTRQDQRLNGLEDHMKEVRKRSHSNNGALETLNARIDHQSDKIKAITKDYERLEIKIETPRKERKKMLTQIIIAVIGGIMLIVFGLIVDIAYNAPSPLQQTHIPKSKSQQKPSPEPSPQLSQ